MNATFDGARIHQQELDHEIEMLRNEKFLNTQAPQRPGAVTRGLATVGRGMISVGTALASRVDAAQAPRSMETGGRA